MKTIYAYSCLLFGLSFVEMKPLNITGHVGGNVTIRCSDWDTVTDVKRRVKYFCDSPCTEDKHIIIKAESGKTEYKNRIEVTNSAEGLFVTFTNLQESDSKTYYCGAERLGLDLYIEVNLKVTKDDSITSSNSSDNMTDMPTSHTTLKTMLPTASATGGAAESSSPKTTPKKVTAGPTLSFTVTDDSITSSNSSDNTTDMPTSYTTLKTMLPTVSATGGAAESSSPKTTPKKVTAGPTLSFTVTDDSIMSSNSSDNMTDMPTSYTTLKTMLPTVSATGGAGYVPYLTAGVIWIITIVMVVLIPA